MSSQSSCLNISTSKKKKKRKSNSINSCFYTTEIFFFISLFCSLSNSGNRYVIVITWIIPISKYLLWEYSSMVKRWLERCYITGDTIVTPLYTKYELFNTWTGTKWAICCTSTGKVSFIFLSRNKKKLIKVKFDLFFLFYRNRYGWSDISDRFIFSTSNSSESHNILYFFLC